MTKKIRLFLVACLLALAMLCVSCVNMGTPDASTPPSGSGTTLAPSGTTATTLPGTTDGGQNTCAHTDDDNNGLCDKCRVSVLVVVDFYTINDLHGKFDDAEGQEGVDELTTYLRRMQSTDDYTVFLSSGDMWQGSAESNLTRGMILTDWMNELGFVSMTLGNHEFDWGTDHILAHGEAADFPLLAINIYDAKTDRPVSFCQPSVMVERGGIRIGIIGAIGDCLSSISADKTAGIYFKTGDELTDLVKAESERLRREGADLIVYSLHDGYGRSLSSVSTVSSSNLASYYDTALSRGGYVDLVFEGHTHQRYVIKDEYGIYHLQGGGENQSITHAEVAVNSANGHVSVRRAEYIRTSVYAAMEDDPLVDELLAKYHDQIAKADLVVGTNPAYMSSDDLKNLTAKLYYLNGKNKWGADYDIVLGGGYLSVRSPYDLPAGEVKYGDLMTLLPFDNTVVLCSLSGQSLRTRYFENDSYYCFYEAYGEGVSRNIDDNATYYIVTDTYNAYYAPNGLTVVDTYDADTFARDMVADWLGGLSATAASLYALPSEPMEVVVLLPQHSLFKEAKRR